MGAIDLPPSSDAQRFVGIVSDEPFTTVRFDADSTGDDVAIADFRFARASDVENRVLRASIAAVNATNLAAVVTGIASAPPVSTGAGVTAIATSVAAKHIRAPLQAPRPR